MARNPEITAARWSALNTAKQSQRIFSLDSLYNADFVYFPLIFIFAAAIRLVILPVNGLWYDELQSVTHSILPVKDLLLSVGKFDPHPPLYYLQLHIWMLFGASDEWIKLNSVCWSLLTLIVLFFLCRDLFNPKIAYLAALLFAISPFAISYAEEARMYALLMFCGVSSLYFFHRFVKKENGWYLLGGIAMLLIFLYSHGAGFMILVSTGAYAILVFVESGFRKVKIFLMLCLALLTTVVYYLPWLYRASTISVGETVTPDMNDVINTLYILLGGYTEIPAYVKWGAVLLCSLFLALWSIRNSNLRALVVAYVLVPVLFCILVSLLIRPIWLYRTIAYTLPYWCIAIAFTLYHSGLSIERRAGIKLWRYALIVITLSLFGYATYTQQTRFAYNWRIEDAARYLNSVASPGDVIYVPHERVFWGMGWYLAGPGSVNPVTTEHVLDTPSGLTVFSRNALTTAIEETTDWIVYRSIDGIEPFIVDSSNTPGRDFFDMQVDSLGR